MLKNRENTSYFLAKWKNARHGHYIVFETAENKIYVLRFLHSAMDIETHMQD